MCCRIDPHDILVRAGSAVKDEGGYVHEVSQIILHPDFNEDNLDSDIALLKVCISSQVSMNYEGYCLYWCSARQSDRCSPRIQRNMLFASDSLLCNGGSSSTYMLQL